MGNLVRMPYSEVTATLEVLDKEGVLPEHLAMLRKDELLRKQVVNMLKISSPIPPFKCDMTKEGWKLSEQGPAPHGPFNPDIVEFLKPNESSVSGYEMLGRARYELNVNLGQLDAEWLEAHQEVIPKEWRGKYYLVFPGTVWQDSHGGRHVPYLNWRGDRWCLYFYWLRHDWSSLGRLVCLRKPACR